MLLSETMSKRKKSKTPAPPTQGRGGRKKSGSGAPSKVTAASSAKSGTSSPLSSLDPRQLRFLLAGGIGLVVIVVVVLVVSLGGDDNSNPMPTAELAAAGCTPFAAVAPTEWDHVPDGDETPEDFETFPRTAGIHDPELLVWNRYTEPVSQMRLGHNLEHGGIYVQYGEGISDETVQTIADWWAKDPNGIIVAPLPELESDVIALGAWWTPEQSDSAQHGDGADSVYLASRGELVYCNQYDEAAFDAFRDSFRGRGPEGFPVNALQPGT